MKIRFVPPSPKAGKEEHVENTAGRALVLAGFAEEIPYKSFRERLAEESKRTAKPLPPIQWAINQSHSNVQYAPKYIVAETGPSGTLYYDAPPSHAPAHVKAKWDKLHAQDAADWKDRREFLNRQANEPKSTSGYNQTDAARALVIGRNGVDK